MTGALVLFGAGLLALLLIFGRRLRPEPMPLTQS
jgi:hypothetical protein